MPRTSKVPPAPYLCICLLLMLPLAIFCRCNTLCSVSMVIDGLTWYNEEMADICYSNVSSCSWCLTRLPLVPHICVGGSRQHWLSPVRRQVIIWINAWGIVNWNLRNNSVKFKSRYKTFHSRKCIWKYRLRNGDHFVHGRWVKSLASVGCSSDFKSVLSRHMLRMFMSTPCDISMRWVLQNTFYDNLTLH